MHFNKPINRRVTQSPPNLNIGLNTAPIENFETASLIAIDSLNVDDRSRITLTKEARKVFDLRAGDTVAIFQDKGRNEIILRVQRQGSIASTLIVREENNSFTTKVHKHHVIAPIRSSSRSVIKASIKESGGTKLNRIGDSPFNRYIPRIVVIDDDKAALLTFQSYLQSVGFGVQIFSNSTEAVEYLKFYHSDYKIVISDIRMPETNGLKLYQKLKSIDKDIKIIFVTALDIVDEVLSILPGFDEKYIMRKPIKRDQFVKRVNSAILEI